jgi:hypothetical protein
MLIRLELALLTFDLQELHLWSRLSWFSIVHHSHLFLFGIVAVRIICGWFSCYRAMVSFEIRHAATLSDLGSGAVSRASM